MSDLSSMLIDLNRYFVRLKYDCSHFDHCKHTKAYTKMRQKLMTIGQDLDHIAHNVKFYRELVKEMLESEELKDVIDETIDSSKIDEEDENKSFGHTFMIARESALYSIADAAEMMRVSQATLIRFEAGIDSVSIGFVKEYAEKLGYKLRLQLIP